MHHLADKAGAGSGKYLMLFYTPGEAIEVFLKKFV
jgi:hypothetical protein